LAGLMAVLYIPMAQRTLGFSHLHVNDLAACFAAAGFSFIWFEVVKGLGQRAHVRQ